MTAIMIMTSNTVNPVTIVLADLANSGKATILLSMILLTTKLLDVNGNPNNNKGSIIMTTPGLLAVSAATIFKLVSFVLVDKYPAEAATSAAGPGISPTKQPNIEFFNINHQGICDGTVEY